MHSYIHTAKNRTALYSFYCTYPIRVNSFIIYLLCRNGTWRKTFKDYTHWTIFSCFLFYLRGRWGTGCMCFILCLCFRVKKSEDVPLVEFMYLVFTRMAGERCRRRLGSLLYLCWVFRALINSLVCCFWVIIVHMQTDISFSYSWHSYRYFCVH